MFEVQPCFVDIWSHKTCLLRFLACFGNGEVHFMSYDLFFNLVPQSIEHPKPQLDVCAVLYFVSHKMYSIEKGVSLWNDGSTSVE